MLVFLAVYPVILMATWSIVLLSVTGVLLVGLIVLYILGTKRMKKQEEAEATMMEGAQTTSMLIIDKKMMKIKDAGFPDIVLQNIPKYQHGMKVPVVKAKVGPQVATLMCDAKIFDYVPVKKEVKATINGIYIIKVAGLRGPLEVPQEKPGFFKRLYLKAQKQVDETKKVQKASKKK